jgi:hypothetical protein
MTLFVVAPPGDNDGGSVPEDDSGAGVETVGGVVLPADCKYLSASDEEEKLIILPVTGSCKLNDISINKIIGRYSIYILLIL